MKKNVFWVSFCTVILALLSQVSNGQISQTETRILFQIQKLLEYPESLQNWSNWTNFCYLPPSPSLKITCSNNHITELTIIGNKTSNSLQSLSQSFSIDSFFTVLTKLSNLRLLSLVSLGIWGLLPAKVNRFSSLEVLNISSNFINGGIPTTITKLQNLKSLVLAHNLLNGTVPDLNSLSALEELDLSGNRFGPGFPSLGISLVSVLLRNNTFRSEIPSKVENLNKLQQLDVAYNKFMGPIPSSLFSLPSIQYLSLAYNQFSGELSVNISCSSKLQFVDISHNLLIGKLPTCVGSKSSNRTVVSSWNCLSSGDLRYQNKYSFCHKEAMAVKPPPKEKQESKTKLGLMLGIIGGIVGFAVVAILVALVIIRRGRRRNRSETTKLGRSVADKTSLHSSPLSEIESRAVPQTMRSTSLGLPQYRVFTLEEIEEATNNFDPLNLMGEGPQGQIYKGRLSYGSVVLVKCQKLKQKHLPQNLTQQMEVLQNLRHRHLVSVLGYCIVTYQDHPNTSSTVFIVTEHVSNGSLRDYLTDWRKKEMLKWPQRMAITIGAARGVLFLHTGIAPRIYGNNLKIENILLDGTLSAKISNYNIPLPFNAPDVPGSRNGNAEKQDIYQLGVILLEVLTGKIIASTSELDELKRQLEKGLTEATPKLRGVVDPSIQGSFAYDSLKTTAQITINCLNKDSSKRPSMEDVLWNLQYSMQVQEGWTSSGNLGMTM